jgi:hypothetical protein
LLLKSSIRPVQRCTGFFVAPSTETACMSDNLTMHDQQRGGPDPRLLQANLKRLLRSVTDQMAAELIEEHARRMKSAAHAPFTPSTQKE